MNTILLVGGLMLGSAGSFHCIGMCGPLSLALPIHGLNSPLRKLTLLFTYQVGRILTYSFLGALIGIAGRPLQIGQYQQVLSVAVGSLVVITALLYHRSSFSPRWPAITHFFNGVQEFIVKRIRSARSPHHFFALGVANGWLPCGLVYVALASTFSFGNIQDSMGFMAAFGTGTLPSMLLIGLSGQLITPKLRISLQKMVPFLVALLGVLLILRGLDLGIPYLSPELPKVPTDGVNCHPS